MYLSYVHAGLSRTMSLIDIDVRVYNDRKSIAMIGTSKFVSRFSESRWLVRTGETSKPNGSLSMRLNTV